MYKIEDKKKFLIFVLLALAVISALVAGGFFAWKKWKNKNPLEEKQETVWEAMIQTKGQNKYETAEDRKTFFENGDVLVIFPAGHAWTAAEKEELIVKLEIKKEDADKLMESETKTADGRADQETETVRLRKYQIDLGDVDKNNSEKVYGERVIEEK